MLGRLGGKRAHVENAISVSRQSAFVVSVRLPGHLLASSLPAPQNCAEPRNGLSEFGLPCRFAAHTNVAGVERLVACGDTFAIAATGSIGEPHAAAWLERGRCRVRSVHALAHDRSSVVGAGIGAFGAPFPPTLSRSFGQHGGWPA